uniref:Endonuclease/exonuclease/phosphatase domain-containing protein n=1 Tax=Tetranychus urticae TaxID=32264 RepID=T1JPZ0_TETUR
MATAEIKKVFVLTFNMQKYRGPLFVGLQEVPKSVWDRSNDFFEQESSRSNSGDSQDTGFRMVTAIIHPIGIGFINTHRVPETDVEGRKTHWTVMKATVSRLMVGGLDRYQTMLKTGAKALIIVGDFNADIGRNKTTDDKQLIALMKEFDLQAVSTTDTYFCEHSSAVASFKPFIKELAFFRIQRLKLVQVRYGVVNLLSVIEIVDQPELFASIKVRDDPWLAKEKSPEEFWPHYLIIEGTESQVKYLKTKYKKPNGLDKRPEFKEVKKLMFDGQDIASTSQVQKFFKMLAKKPTNEPRRSRSLSPSTQRSATSRSPTSSPQLSQTAPTRQSPAPSTSRFRSTETPEQQPGSSTGGLSNPKWFEINETSWHKDAPLWRVITYYRIEKAQAKSKVKFTDYTEEPHEIISDDYQILDKSGKVWRDDDLRAFVRKEYLTPSQAAYKSYCIADFFKPFKKCVFHCVSWGDVSAMKKTLATHGEKCLHLGRVAKENPLTANQIQDKKSEG